MTEFNTVESCGKCTPCREGTIRMLGLIDAIAAGSASEADLDQVRSWCEVVEYGSLCGLGQMAPRPILSALEHFSPSSNGVSESA
jgi:NADH-quinone oxidoreductase subunit F/NADP-reducing hydrogenase subunit HndC